MNTQLTKFLNALLPDERNEVVESLLLCLRRAGVSKMQCVRVVHELLTTPPDQALLLVHNSHAWRDRQETDAQTNEELVAALSDLSREFSPNITLPKKLDA